MLILLLLPPQGEDSAHSSHSSPAAVWGPSHYTEFSMNCSNVSPFHGVQSAVKNRLLWRGSPVGSQVLPEDLLQHGLPIGSQPPSGIHLLRSGVLHGLQVNICSTMDLRRLQEHGLPHRGLLHGLQGNFISGARNTSSPSFFIDLRVCRIIYLTYSHTTLPQQQMWDFFSASELY